MQNPQNEPYIFKIYFALILVKISTLFLSDVRCPFSILRWICLLFLTTTVQRTVQVPLMTKQNFRFLLFLFNKKFVLQLQRKCSQISQKIFDSTRTRSQKKYSTILCAKNLPSYSNNKIKFSISSISI